jgi:hypothetical protein
MTWFNGSMMLAAMVLLVGCSTGIDEKMPIDQVVVDASQMKPKALEDKIDRYEMQIAKETAGMNDIKKQLKEIPLSELLGEKAKALKSELSGLTASRDQLGRQMEVYARELAVKR